MPSSISLTPTTRATPSACSANHWSRIEPRSDTDSACATRRRSAPAPRRRRCGRTGRRAGPGRWGQRGLVDSVLCRSSPCSIDITFISESSVAIRWPTTLLISSRSAVRAASRGQGLAGWRSARPPPRGWGGRRRRRPGRAGADRRTARRLGGDRGAGRRTAGRRCDVEAGPVHDRAGEAALDAAQGQQATPAGHVRAAPVRDHHHITPINRHDHLRGDVRTRRVSRVRLQRHRAGGTGQQGPRPLRPQLTRLRRKPTIIQGIATTVLSKPARRRTRSTAMNPLDGTSPIDGRSESVAQQSPSRISARSQRKAHKAAADRCGRLGP